MATQETKVRFEIIINKLNKIRPSNNSLLSNNICIQHLNLNQQLIHNNNTKSELLTNHFAVVHKLYV